LKAFAVEEMNLSVEDSGLLDCYTLIPGLLILFQRIVPPSYASVVGCFKIWHGMFDPAIQCNNPAVNP